MKSLKEMGSEKKYFPEIDLLKAFAALLVIFIHIMGRFRGNSDLNFAIWDLAHFGVGSFVLASGFLQANAPLKSRKLVDIWDWFKKRFIRVVVPYYIFAVLYVAVAILVDGWSRVSGKFSWDYLLDTVILQGGVGNNWIPRLFFWLMIVYLLLELIRPYINSVYKWAFGFTAVISTYLLIGSIHGFSHVNNIPGWLMIYITGYFLYLGYENWKETFWKIIKTSAFILLLTSIFLYGVGDSLIVFGHKYPPDLYFIAYNILMASSVLGIFRWLNKKGINGKIQKQIAFLSHASYDIFFYHLIVLKFYPVLFELLFGVNKVSILVDYVVVVALTYLVVYVKRNVIKLKI